MIPALPLSGQHAQNALQLLPQLPHPVTGLRAHGVKRVEVAEARGDERMQVRGVRPKIAIDRADMRVVASA